MKVLHLIDSGGLYGAEQMLLALAEEQIKQGLEPIILSCGLPNEADKPLEIEAESRKITVKNWRMTAGLNFSGAWKILKFAQQNNVDIIHSHGYKFNILFAIFPRPIRKIPFVTTVHGYVFAKKYSAMSIYQWLDKLALKMADIICLVSPSMKNIPSFKHKSSTKIKVIPNGINEHKTVQIDFQHNHQASLNLLAIGRIVREKDFSLLIDAVALAIKKGNRLSLTIMGEGPLKSELEEQIGSLALTDVVNLAGFIDQPAQYFDSFDALVMSSTTEGLPITLLEAMRDKLPIIATRVGGIPYLLGDSDYLVPSQQVEPLSQAIIKMAAQCPEEREKIALENQRRFLVSYTSKIMNTSYLGVYHEAISS
jgi:glycosyltransferase involved in cell wall biosynthesis